MTDQEPHPVADRELKRLTVARRRHRGNSNPVAHDQPGAFQACPHLIVQRANLSIRLGDQQHVRVGDDALGFLPGIDQSPDRCFLASGESQAAALVERSQACFGSSICEISDGFAHPALALPHDGVDAGGIRDVGDNCQPRSGTDGLELCAVANQDDLGAGFHGFADDRVHLARGQEAGLVDDEHCVVV